MYCICLTVQPKIRYKSGQHVGDAVCSDFDRYIKFTEMLNDAEDELGISSFSGVEKEIIYTIVKAAQNGEGFPSRIYCKGSISPGQRSIVICIHLLTVAI